MCSMVACAFTCFSPGETPYSDMTGDDVKEHVLAGHQLESPRNTPDDM